MGEGAPQHVFPVTNHSEVKGEGRGTRTAHDGCLLTIVRERRSASVANELAGPANLQFDPCFSRHPHGRPKPTHEANLQSEAPIAKNAPESAICGVFRMSSAPNELSPYR
jgi:hypothetical protein